MSKKLELKTGSYKIEKDTEINDIVQKRLTEKDISKDVDLMLGKMNEKLKRIIQAFYEKSNNDKFDEIWLEITFSSNKGLEKEDIDLIYDFIIKTLEDIKSVEMKTTYKASEQRQKKLMEDVFKSLEKIKRITDFVNPSEIAIKTFSELKLIKTEGKYGYIISITKKGKEFLENRLDVKELNEIKDDILQSIEDAVEQNKSVRVYGESYSRDHNFP